MVAGEGRGDSEDECGCGSCVICEVGDFEQERGGGVEVDGDVLEGVPRMKLRSMRELAFMIKTMGNRKMVGAL